MTEIIARGYSSRVPKTDKVHTWSNVPTGGKAVIRLLFLWLIVFLLAVPAPALAQEQLGSVTVKKLPTSLDSPGLHPVRFEISGENLPTPITLYSSSDMVQFTDLPAGTYTIREQATRTGDIARATIAPVKVTIPRDGLFDVLILPKPQPLTLILSADITRINPGSTFSYSLDGAIPYTDANGELHRYVLKNALPEGLTLTGDSSMRLHIGARTIFPTEGDHYIITTQGDAGRGDSIITVAFTPAGLALLAHKREEHADAVVSFTFGVRASKDLRPGSYVFNTAYLYPDGYPEHGEDAVISNEHSLPVVSSGDPTFPLIPGAPGSPEKPGGSTTTRPGSPQKNPVLTPIATPDSPLASGPSERPEPRQPLASTGANVLGILVLGALLSIIGITLLMRGHRA